MEKLPEYMLKKEDKDLIAFCKQLAKIQDINEDSELLMLAVINYDKRVFGNDRMVSSFVHKNLSLLSNLNGYFDYQEIYTIKKNFEFIRQHPYIFPKLMPTAIYNKYYQDKYNKNIKYLYLTNKERTLIAKKLLNELKDNHFSQQKFEEIKHEYGFKTNDDIISILNFVLYHNELEAILISYNIKPYTEIYSITKNKSYLFSWRIKGLVKELINVKTNEDIQDIIDKMINERTTILHNSSEHYTSFLRERIYSLGYYLLDSKEYDLLMQKTSHYFDKEEQKQRNEKNLKVKLKRETKRVEMLEKATKVIDNYLQYKETSEEDLINNLAIIKKLDVNLYQKYIEKIYGADANAVISRFINSKTNSLNEFLFQENISFFTFNRYRLLVNNQLSEELQNKLRKNSVIAYNNIISAVEKLLIRIADDYDYAYMSMILNNNFLLEKTVIGFIENAIKKDRIESNKYHKLKILSDKLKQYMQHKTQYQYGKGNFYQAIASLKEYANVKLTDDLKQEAIKYLIKNNCDVNYYTVRSLLVRYAKFGSFELNDNVNTK